MGNSSIGKTETDGSLNRDRHHRSFHVSIDMFQIKSDYWNQNIKWRMNKKILDIDLVSPHTQAQMGPHECVCTHTGI